MSEDEMIKKKRKKAMDSEVAMAGIRRAFGGSRAGLWDRLVDRFGKNDEEMKEAAFRDKKRGY